MYWRKNVASALGSMLAAAGLMLAADVAQAQSSGEELYLHHCGVCHQPDDWPPLSAVYRRACSATSGSLNDAAVAPAAGSR